MRAAREKIVAVATVFFFASSAFGGGWSCDHCHNVNLKPAPGGFYFDFPKEDGVHYITKDRPAMKAPRRIVMTFKITGPKNTVFQATRDYGAFPAHVRLYITTSEQWWSNPNAYKLQTSKDTITLKVPVFPKFWTNVWGQRATDAKMFFGGWNAPNGKMGMTFGASGFGHGVYLTKGNARFTLISYKLE